MSYEVFASFYDELMSDVDYEKIAEGIDSMVKKYNKNAVSLVDMACGTGTLAAVLAEKGYDVIGVDASCEMLMKAREKCPQNVLLLCQPMDKMDLYGTNDVIICTLDSINHVTDERAVSEIFKNVSLFLENNGIFVFDVNTPYKHKNVLADTTFVIDSENVYCVWQNSLNGDIVDITLDFFERDGDCYYRSGEQFSERAYSREQLEKMLLQWDIEIIEVYGGYDMQPLEENSERAVYITRRKSR